MSDMDKKGGGPLYDKLAVLAGSDLYPFHMPGHKRSRGIMDMPPVADMDITEIDGFDNLHHACGIIAKAQQRAARVCGAGRTWFLVNGSTCGLLAAIFACTRRGGRILVARNCHKAVYNAIELNGLNPVYVYPRVHREYGIYEAVAPEQVRRLLEKYKDIQAVVVTSPTYEGVISDIKAIAGIAHEHQVPLIVDEAHGAHLGFSPEFETSAVACGADLVIQSLHKTLPSMTQTALLHLCGPGVDAGSDPLDFAGTPGACRESYSAPGACSAADRARVDAAKVQKYLSMFQSSSPSYVLMAGMDRCIGLLESQGGALFSAYAGRLARLRGALGERAALGESGTPDAIDAVGACDDRGAQACDVGKQETDDIAGECAAAGDMATDACRLKYIRLLGASDLCQVPGSRYDRSKLVLYVSGRRGMGKWLYDALRDEYHLQMEMVSADYVLGMTSICDTDEGFRRLAKAVRELDCRLEGLLNADADGSRGESFDLTADAPGLPPEVPAMNCFDALQKDTELVQLEKCRGRISAEYLYIYPPGVPFLVPGERITDGALRLIRRYQEAGLEVLGGTDEALERLLVL